MDKVFSNNFILQTEVLYTNKPYDISDLTVYHVHNKPTLRELTTSRWSFAGQIYYPFSNLLSLSSLIAYFIDQKAIYATVELKYQLFKNFETSVMVHAFDYTLGESYSMDGIAGTLHLKYYF
jgi:hypothetical protein